MNRKSNQKGSRTESEASGTIASSRDSRNKTESVLFLHSSADQKRTEKVLLRTGKTRRNLIGNHELEDYDREGRILLLREREQ